MVGILADISIGGVKRFGESDKANKRTRAQPHKFPETGGEDGWWYFGIDTHTRARLPIRNLMNGEQRVVKTSFVRKYTHTG